MERGSGRARGCPEQGLPLLPAVPGVRQSSDQPQQHKCALMPSRWEIPFCTSSMLPQNVMGFHFISFTHTAGLVQGLWVSLSFLVWEEERDARKGEQVIREFFEGLKEELENLE